MYFIQEANPCQSPFPYPVRLLSLHLLVPIDPPFLLSPPTSIFCYSPSMFLPTTHSSTHLLHPQPFICTSSTLHFLPSILHPVHLHPPPIHQTIHLLILLPLWNNISNTTRQVFRQFLRQINTGW